MTYTKNLRLTLPVPQIYGTGPVQSLKQQTTFFAPPCWAMLWQQFMQPFKEGFTYRQRLYIFVKPNPNVAKAMKGKIFMQR